MTIPKSEIHVTISNVYVLCDNVYDISIFQLVSNLIPHKSNLIEPCALLVRMASVNAGSPCEIHRTDPRVDSKNMYHYYCTCLLNNKHNETQAIVEIEIEYFA